MAYINIPYLSGQTDVTRDTSAIVAAIVNLYLLLLLGAVFVSFAFSNQITRPLAELEEKISRLMLPANRSISITHPTMSWEFW